MHLADVNLWLALCFEAHAHHGRAVRWFDRAEPDSCVMCRFAQQGVLRLATSRAVFGEEAVAMTQAWDLYDELLSDERVRYLPEPQGLEPLWRGYTRTRSHSPKVWADAYLAAFAVAAGMGIVSFDTGFTQYAGVELSIPEQ